MQRILTNLLFVLLLLAAGLSAVAQEVRFEPRSIVVNPSPAFSVNVSVDKGGDTPDYRIGERIEIDVRTDRDAYVYLYSIRSDGRVVQILPNRFDEQHRLRAGQTRTYPPRDGGYVFNVDGPTGLARVVAVASTRELDTRELARFESGANFATSDIGQEGFQNAFRIVVRPVPQNSWVTSTASYRVVDGQGRAPASEATVVADSTPQGATVYLDGRRQGTTPLRISSQPGRRSLTFELDGYTSVQRTLNLSPGETRRVDERLERDVRTGSLRFESSPSGAEVFVDGRFLGTTPVGSREFDPGRYEVTFERSGYRTERRTVQVSVGSSDTVRANLAPLTGSIAVTANVGGAEVYLDGRPAGTIPSGSGRLVIDDIEPGTYEITVVAAGYATAVTQQRVRSGETHDVRIRQERR